MTETLNEDLPYLFRAFGAPAEWTNQRTSIADQHEVVETERVAEEDAENKAWVYGKKVYKRLEMTDALRDRLHEDNGRDVKLHRLAGRLRTEKLARLHQAGAATVG